MQATVITFDHLAYSFLGCYGNLSIRTPNFDELAAGSVAFDQCFGTTEDRDGFAGLHTFLDTLRASGGRAVVRRCRTDSAGTSELADALAELRDASSRGAPALLWLRCSAIESPWTAPADQVLASWREASPLPDLTLALSDCGIGPLDSDTPPEHLLAAAWPELLDSGVLSRDRFAATPLIGRLRRCVYGAAVMAVDAWLGRVLEALNAPGRPDNLLIVTAGAGDLAGPHSGLSAGCPAVVDPLVRVPLLIRTGTPADGSRRGGLASTADLAPTLAEWFGNPPSIPQRSASRSLWPLLRDESHAVRDDLLIGSPTLGWNLRTLEFACVIEPADGAGDVSPDAAADRARLFVKPDDAWDTLDVARQYQSVTDDRCRRILELVRRSSDQPDFQ